MYPNFKNNFTTLQNIETNLLPSEHLLQDTAAGNGKVGRPIDWEIISIHHRKKHDGKGNQMFQHDSHN